MVALLNDEMEVYNDRGPVDCFQSLNFATFEWVLIRGLFVESWIGVYDDEGRTKLLVISEGMQANF